MKRIMKRSLVFFMAVVMCFSMTTVNSSAKASFSTAVKGVSISSTSPNNLKVTWKAKTGASSYEVYMSDTKAGEYTLIAKTTKRSVKVTSSVEGESLDLTHIYYFKVRAYSKKKKKFSKYSAIKGGRPKLSAPTFSISVPTNHQAKVKVTKTVAEADGYLVYRSVYKDKKFAVLGAVDPDTNIGYEKITKQNKYYYFKVRAYKTVDDVTYYGNFSSVKKVISDSTINGNNTKKYAIPSGTVYKSTLKSHGTTELYGREVLCVGSSVVRGAYANGTSFADYLGKFNKCTVVKEAVDGTTMAVREGHEGESFLERLVARADEMGEEWQPEIVLIQLSSNDAGKIDPSQFGDVTAPGDTDYNVYTSIGSIESMIAFTHEKWPQARLIFFTMPKREAPRYELLREKLLQVQDKWGDDPTSGFKLIDLWTDEKTNAITEGSDKYRLYMYDRLHPTMAGHMKYIEPVIETGLCELLASEPPVEPDPPVEPEPEPEPEE